MFGTPRDKLTALGAVHRYSELIAIPLGYQGAPKAFFT